MKIIIRVFLSLFLLVFGAAFLLQTPFAKNEAKRLLISAAQDAGLELNIGAIEGTLPFDWQLKDVAFTFEEQHVSVESIYLRLAILPLFKKQLEVTHLKARGGEYAGIPFKAIAKGAMDMKENSPIKLSHLLIEGDDLFVRLEAKIHRDLSIQEGHLAFHLPDISILGQSNVKGSFMGMAEISEGIAHLECFGEELFIKDVPLTHSSLTIDAKKNRAWWDGSIKISGGHAAIPVNGIGDFRFTPNRNLVSIDNFKVTGPEISIFGKLGLNPNLHCVEGSVFAQCFDLKVLRPLFPDSYIKGCVGAKFDFQSFSRFQDMKCQIELENFAAYEGACKTLIIESTAYDLFGELRGEFSIEGQAIDLPEIQLAEVEVKSTFEPQSSPFEFALKGNWKDPLKITGKGNWQQRGTGIFFNVDALNGFAFKNPFSLCEPFSLEWNTEHFKMSNFSMDIAQGHISSRIDLSKNASLIKVKANDFPLAFIALPHKHFSLAGASSFDIDVVAWENSIRGSCNIALERAHFLYEGSSTPLTTKGSLQIHLNDNIAQVHAELKAKDKQFAQFFGSFPIEYQHFPFQIRINPDMPFSSQLVAEGKLEDLFNFINIGHHRLEGWLSTTLHASKSLNHPSLRGSLELQDGLYENYYTGTHLKKIFAEATADRQTIHINHLQAADTDSGNVTGQGKILLSPIENFPFSFTADLDELATVSFDTITGKFSGKMTISGDKLGAMARGKLKVAEATFRIPDELPSVLPELPIKFVNAPEALIRKSSSTPAVSPLQLDLDLSVPGRARVEGRGLNAELKGKLHISGTYTDIVARGTLQLVTGEYLFSGKVFKLSQGELVFNDKPTPSAYISLSGDCDLPDVNVTVILRGPLTAPKLTFQSSPQLPTSSLLAQILFNKDISEISAVQALQLAQTVISLSGGSAPDVLEKIRKTLGIDRLTLVTSENDPGKISLQIGKYLMRGVLLTLSQGAESRNVSVEVDLKKGVKLQAEVNEDQQGKFSLKWHHHY